MFDTTGQVLPEAGADRYRIDEIEVTVTLSDPLLSGYDPSVDEWTTHLRSDDPAYELDSDPGRPIELFPTGFRNGVGPMSWTENTDFSLVGPFGYGVRSAFAADFDSKGRLVDVSNSVTEGRTPVSLAVGMVEGASSGEELPEGSVVRFTFSGDDPRVEAWLGEGLNAGRVHFTLSSLIEAVEQGGDFVDLYLRENPLVTAGIRSAATLRILGEIVDRCDAPGDLDHDCLIGGGDIGILLSRWGTDDPEADLNGDLVVDGSDFGVLLSLF